MEVEAFRKLHERHSGKGTAKIASSQVYLLYFSRYYTL